MSAHYDGSVRQAVRVAAEHGVSPDALIRHLDGIREPRVRLRATAGVAVDAVLLAHADRSVEHLPEMRVAYWASVAVPSPHRPLVVARMGGVWEWVEGLPHRLETLAAVPGITVVTMDRRHHEYGQTVYRWTPVELTGGPDGWTRRIVLTVHAQHLLGRSVGCWRPDPAR